MSALLRDVGAVALFLLVLLYWKGTYGFRGVTYRKNVVPLWQEQLTKALFYVGLLGILDALLRRGGEALWRLGVPVYPSSAETAAYMRIALIYLPWAAWAVTGPLSERGSTRDDRGFSPSATHARIWKWGAKIFPHCKVFISEEWVDLKQPVREKWQEQNYVIAMHPHGLLPFGAILAGLTWAGGGLQGQTPSGKQLPTIPNPGPHLHQAFFKNMRLRAAVATGACGLFPGFYEMFTKLGAFECTKPFIQKILREGKDVAIFPGGAQEAEFATPKRYVALIKKHKGFVRLALEERRNILPMWTFGDEATCPQWQNPPAVVSGVQSFFKECTGLLVPPAFSGMLRFEPLTLVIGVPVDLSDLWAGQVGGQVGDAAVDEGHRRYAEAQRMLFDRNKAFVPGGHGKGIMEVL